MGRRTVRHRDIRRKRRSEKEESIKKEKLGQRGDHPTRNGPESFLYCPRLWRSSTGFLNRNSLSQRLEPKATDSSEAMEETDSTEVKYKIRQWSLPGATIVPVLNVSS